MSLIVSGKSCKACKQEYWVTFGHPPWAYVEKDPRYKKFKKMALSKYCPACYLIKQKKGELTNEGVD